MLEPLYITTPIYYVNDKPHIGTAYTTIICDIIARFYRLNDRQVKFVTGTDEHGQKVEKAAKKNDKDPQTFVDEVSKNFRHLVARFKMTNDDFIRTTEKRHHQAAQALWEKVQENGYIYEGFYEGWYAVQDECFYDESEIIDGKAPSGATVEWVKESSYFFKLSAFQEKILDHLTKNPSFIQPQSRFNEVLSFVKSGLRDLSISRTTFHWGIPVPNDSKHIMYVWFDALTNYLTVLGYPDQQSLEMKNFWPYACHVIGKDILRFHAVYWPAFLLAANLPLPKMIFAHGWWTKDGQKISKSLSNVVDPMELADRFGIDAVRYFLIREVSLGQDGDYTESALVARYTSELANAFGNLSQRVLSFIFKNCDGRLNQSDIGDLIDADEKLLEASNTTLEQCQKAMAEFALHRYCEHVLHLSHLANQYVDHFKPWSIKETNPERMKTVLWVLAQIIKRLAMLYQPILVEKSEKLLDYLGTSQTQRSLNHFGDVIDINIDRQPDPLFPRI